MGHGSGTIVGVGPLAEDAAIVPGSGNPLVVAYRAADYGTAAAPVDTVGDVVRYKCDAHGTLFTMGCSAEQKRYTNLFTSQEILTTIITASPGKKLVFAGFTLSVSRDIGVDALEILLGGGIFYHKGLSPGGSVVEGNGAGIIDRPIGATLLLTTDPANPSGSYRVSVSYYEVDV